jgi:hypothetical protein
MFNMFFGARAYNQPLKDWDVSKVIDMSSMFYDAAAFNQNLCAWGNVASFPYSSVSEMFVNSGCTYKNDPTQATKGPFCADDCTAVQIPSVSPTESPTASPTASPSLSPTDRPTAAPSRASTDGPT